MEMKFVMEDDVIKEVFDNWPYIYKAQMIDLYDGDSVTLDIDLGFNTLMTQQKCRLYGLDTPEIRGSNKEFGKLVKEKLHEFINEAFAVGYILIVNTHKDKAGKFGRWLVTMFLSHDREHVINVNKWLIDNKYAIEYLGGSKDGFEMQHARNYKEVMSLTS
tara:strand:+ start:1781 stop:2263 length:483 start_codon:yes stop_codon:yes gene_type:complete